MAKAKTETKKGAPAWPAAKVESRKLSEIVPYARNARTHSAEQVDQIAASIREWGWTNPILVTPDGTIIAGHGRVLAAQKLGLGHVPAMVAEGWTEAQIRAYVIADNKLALNAGWSEGLLAGELSDLQSLGFDLDLTGFQDFEIEELNSTDENGDELSENYSRKIEAPIYEITGSKPELKELIDTEKRDGLAQEIEASNQPPEIKKFLLAAADRHSVFNYRNIAEYYAHADAELQELMERSALIIIDYDKAIEGGFVKLSESMMAEVGRIKKQTHDENE